MKIENNMLIQHLQYMRIMPPRKRDEETGRYTEKSPVNVFSTALRDVDFETPSTTAEIAEFVGCDHDTTYKELRELEDADQSPVSSRKVGNTLCGVR